MVGCPRIDLVKECLDKKIKDLNIKVFKNGVGEKFDLNKEVYNYNAISCNYRIQTF